MTGHLTLSLMLILAIIRLVCLIKSEKSLQHDKLLDYNKNIIPRLDEDLHVTVNVSMFPLNIIRFNEREELLYFSGFLRVCWNDYYLAWDPALYGNLTSTIYRQEQIWLPDLVLGFSKEDMKQIGFDNQNLLVDSFGNVFWEPGICAEVICAVDTTYFPFDRQTCDIVITTWVHSPNVVHFASAGLSLNSSLYIENGQWELLSYSSEVREHDFFSSLYFKIILKRRSGYYVTSLIVPVITISTLSCFVFLIPKDSGEKISYGVTTFLSYMVLLTLTTDNLPKTSKQRPLFVIYLGCMLALAFFSVLCSVISCIKPLKASGNNNSDTDDLDDNTAYESCQIDGIEINVNSGVEVTSRRRPNKYMHDDNVEELSCTSRVKTKKARWKGLPIVFGIMNKWQTRILSVHLDHVMFVLVTGTTVIITSVTLYVLINNSS